MRLIKLILPLLLVANFFVFAQNKFLNHKILKGETLTQISEKYKVSAQELLKLNPDAVSGLKEDGYLIIPILTSSKEPQIKNVNQESTKTHIVEAKETIFGLSKKYNVSIEELTKANPGLNDGLKIGEHLIIPLTSDNQIENKQKSSIDKAVVQDIHIVKAGETKFSLAKKYGLTIEELENLNPEIKNGLPVDFKLNLKKNSIIDSQKKPFSNTTNQNLKDKSEKIDLEKNQIIVKKGMTLYGIATDNNISVDDLLKANPSLNDGLKENEIINIPNINSKPKQAVNNISKNSSKRIAILLPFNQIEKSKIELKLSKDKFLNMVADYYLGAKIAIDSAKTKKMKHDVQFFDSNETENTSQVEELVNSGKLNNFDIIIGCFYPNNNDKLVQLLTDKPVVVVSPIRFQTYSYATLVETMVKKEELYDEMIKYFKKSDNNFLSIIDSKKTSSLVYFEKQSDIKNFKFEDKDIFKSDEFIAALDKEKNNIIFFDSESLKFLTKINQLVSSLKTDGYKVQIVSVDHHVALEADEVFNDFIKNELIYLSTYDNRDTDKTKLFDKNFRSKYKSMPNQFVYRGYDIVIDVFERASVDSTFINSLMSPSTQLNTKFNYSKNSNNGYKNKGFYLLKMNKNLTITSLE